MGGGREEGRFFVFLESSQQGMLFDFDCDFLEERYTLLQFDSRTGSIFPHNLLLFLIKLRCETMPPLSFLYYQIKFMTQHDLDIMKGQSLAMCSLQCAFIILVRFFFIYFAITEGKKMLLVITRTLYIEVNCYIEVHCNNVYIVFCL